MDVHNGHCPENVANGRYPTGVGVDYPGTHTQRDHRHPGHMTPGNPLESIRGAHRHSSNIQSPFPWCSPRVPGQKMDDEGYNKAEARARASQCRPRRNKFNTRNKTCWKILVLLT